MSRVGMPEWHSDRFDRSLDANKVFVLFRKLSRFREEPRMNRLAAWWTSNERDKKIRGGIFHHVEVVMQVQAGVFYRFSIMKKTILVQEDGTETVFRGRTHAKRLDPRDPTMKEYVCVAVPMFRRDQVGMLQFLERQHNGTFDMLRYLLGWTRLFPRRFTAQLYTTQIPVTCVILVILSLQASGAIPALKGVDAAAESPNSLYRLLVDGVGCKIESLFGNSAQKDARLPFSLGRKEDK